MEMDLMINNRIKPYLDDNSKIGWPTNADMAGHLDLQCPASSSAELSELKAFIDSVEDMVCKVMGEAFCEGKLFGVNIMVNPETREFRIWRTND